MIRVTAPLEAFHRALEDLRKVPGIEAAALVRRDGLLIAHRLPIEADPRKVGTMSAAIVGTSEMATEALEQGRFQQSVVESQEGKVIAVGAGPLGILVALVRPEANLGMALMTIERQAEKVASILGSL